MIAHSRGSHMPGWCGFSEAPHTGDDRIIPDPLGLGSRVEQQPAKAPVAGSDPALQRCFETA